MQFVGLPYKWAGENPLEGYDCSGFVLELLRASGVLSGKFDYTSAALHNKFLEKCEPTFGALAFYGDPISHVGFCVNEHFMLEAGGGNSFVKTKEDAAKMNAFIRLRPVMSRSDFRNCSMPNYPWRK